MLSFIIDSFSGGISDFESKGIKGSFKFGSALDIRKKVDSLSCQQALVDEGVGVIAAKILFIVPASDGNTYGFGGIGSAGSGVGKIYKRTPAGVWSEVYSDATFGLITGAAEWFDNTGNSFLYWATAIRLNRKELPGTGVEPWNDVNADSGWPKSDLLTYDWHTMKPANGALMICNNRYLAMVGYDNSYTNNALDLIGDNRARTLIERGDYVLIGTGKKTSSSHIQLGELFVWEQNALSWIKKKQIPAKGINALIDTEVTLMQAGTDGGIYFSDLVNVLPVTSFPGGGQCNPDAVDVDGGLALFGVYGNGSGNTGVYSYGRKNKNSPFVLNFEYPLTADEIYSVKKVGSDILISYKNGGTYGVKKVDTSTKATAVYESLDLKVPPDLPARPVNWSMVKLLTAPIVSGTSISLKYKINKSGNWTTAFLPNGSSSFNNVGETEAVFLVGAEGKIFEFQLTLTPTGNTSPEVYRIEVFFE